MESLKELQEKRAKLFADGQEIVDNAKDGVEVRSLNEAEITKADEIKEEIRQLDIKIAEEKENRAKGAVSETREAIAQKKENIENMTKEQEVRSLDLYLRGQAESEEYRDLTASISAGNAVASTPGNGGVTIPKNVAADVIAKLGEVSPIFSLSRQIPSVTGVLTVPRQGSLEASSFTGELENIAQLKPQFETVDLTQKRVGAFIQLTDQILNDSAIDLVSYSTEYLAQSLGRALEKNILVGVDKGFSPIIGHVAPENAVTFADPAAPTIDEMIDLTNAVNPAYLVGSAFYVSRPVYNVISKLKDGDGQYLFFRGDTATAGHPTFAGYPVYVSESLAGQDVQVIFGNASMGYSVMIKEGIALTLVQGDTTQVLAGGKLLAITGYMDGTVTDPYAFATAKKA